MASYAARSSTVSLPFSEESSSERANAMRSLADEMGERGVQRVHVLAWRDLDDVEAGGSEVHAGEFMRRWAVAGLEITHRTSAAAGIPATARRHGYEVIRRGSRYSVFPRTAVAELTRRMGKFDALVEIWNGVPWMSPLWCRKPRMTLLHHVHGPMWAETFPQPFASIGRVMEARLAPPFYRRTQMVALSDGTRDEIRELGISEERISCVLPGVDAFFQPGADKAAVPTVLAVGRLAAGKRFPALLPALLAVRSAVPELQAIIVGEGPDRESIESWIAQYNAASWLTLLGRVSPDELLRHYQRAWLVTSASIAEGWGMTLTEAGACATPAVVTDVNGHRNAVEHGVTGLLADLGDLATAITSLLTDHERRLRMGAAARTFANTLTWDRTAHELLHILHGQVVKQRPLAVLGLG